MTSIVEDRHRRLTGLTRRQLAALVATVVAYETDGYPVWRGFVTEAVARAGEILTAGDGLLDQSMGASYGIGESFVPMGGHHGWKCRCGTWVWGGPTVCQRCVDAEAVKTALGRGAS